MPNSKQGVWISIKFSIIGTLLVFLLLLAFFSGCVQQTKVTSNTVMNVSEQEIAFNDSMDNRIVLSHPAERIIVGGANAAEMLIAIGAANKIIGVDKDTTERKDIMENLHPDVKSIGFSMSPDVETISQLKPDVFIAYSLSRPKNADKYLTLNCTIYFFKFKYLDELNDEINALGEMTGNREGAQRYIKFNRIYQDLIESRLANLTPDEELTVYGESMDYYVTNRFSSGGRIISALHANNVYENSEIESPKLAPEWLLTKDPDVIIKIEGWGGQVVPFSSIHDAIMNRTGSNNLKAVKSNRVYVVNSKLLYTPQAVVGEIYLAKALYPERFADIDPEAVRQEYIREFHVANYSAEWIYPPFEPVNGSVTKANVTVQNATSSI